MDKIQKKVIAAKKRFAAAMEEQQPWRQRWRELSKNFSPFAYRSLSDGDTTNDDSRKDTRLTMEPGKCVTVLANGMHGGMTSPSRPWFRLGLQDMELEGDEASRAWLTEVANRMLDIMSRSNFYDQIYQAYVELIVFGTCALYCIEDLRDNVNFHTLTTGEYFLVTDHTRRVVGCGRKLQYSAEQMIDRFGEKRVSETVYEASKDPSQANKLFTIVHFVRPQRTEEGRLDASGKPYESFYWEDSGKPEDYLEYGGYDEQPFAAARWNVYGQDVYGKGPGHDNLNDAKMLQSQMASYLKLIHTISDPPMVGPVTLKGKVVTYPASMNFVSNENENAMIRPLIQHNPAAVEALMMSVERTKQDLREGFYNDLFKMLALTTTGQQNRTATEVQQLVEEKLQQLGPIVERLHSELFSPLIDRLFSICVRQGVIPPPPPALQGRPLKVEFVSMLAQAQKMVGTSAIVNWLGLVAQASTILPEAVDLPDTDAILKAAAEMYGLSPKMVRSDEERGARREGRAAQQQMMIEQEQMAQTAKSARDLGSIPVDQPTALSALTGGMMQ